MLWPNHQITSLEPIQNLYLLLGGDANPMTPQQFREFITAESATFKRVIEQANVKLPE